MSARDCSGLQRIDARHEGANGESPKALNRTGFGSLNGGVGFEPTSDLDDHCRSRVGSK
jgi:hypothetical protein